MALVSIQILDGQDSIQVTAAVEPGIEPGQEDLSPAQSLGVLVLEAMKVWLDAAEKEQAAKPVIARPQLHVPRG